MRFSFLILPINTRDLPVHSKINVSPDLSRDLQVDIPIIEAKIDIWGEAEYDKHYGFQKLIPPVSIDCFR